MGAAARAGRDAYARACLVDASERRLASRKSIAREEDLELHLWAPHWNGGSILDFACFFATCRRFFATCAQIGLFCDLSAIFCDLSWFVVVRPGPNPFPETGFPESEEVLKSQSERAHTSGSSAS